MSKDIRSWFQVVKPKNNPEKKVELSDEDVIPESPHDQIKKKKKESRKKRVLEDSSDEEIFSKKKLKTTGSSTKTPTPTKDKGKSDKGKKSLKEVKAVDIFGGGPIKRTEPIVKKKKKELKTEIGIHDDDDFEKSLLEIDASIVNVNGDDRTKNNSDGNIHEVKSSYFNGETSKGKKEDVSKSISPEKQEATSKKSEGKNNKISEEKPLTNGEAAKSKSSKTKETSFENKSKEKTSKESSEGKSSKNTHKLKDRSPGDKPKHKELSKIKSEQTITITDDKTESKDQNQKLAKPKSFKIPKIKTEKSNSTTESKSKEDQKSPKKSSPSNKDDKVEKRAESLGKSKLEAKLEKSDKKRDFSEFINDDVEVTQKEEEVDAKQKNKKKKLDTSLNSSVISDEERHERKRHSAALYQSYLNRSGPKNLGAKEIPEGSPNCLKECSFLLTGVLESFERDEVAEAIKKYGGCVKSGISRKVTHVLAGDDAGPAKLAKAEELGIRVINEDQFLTLIKDLSNPTKPGKAAPSSSEKDESKYRDKDKNKERQHKSAEKSKEKHAKISEEKMKSFEEKIKKSFYAKSKETPLRIESSPDRDTQEIENNRVTELKSRKAEDNRSYASTSSSNDVKSESSSAASIAPAPGDHLMWVDKYKPQNVKQIIGQHGDASNVKKLMNWLTKWYVNRREKIPKPSPWAKNDDGAYYKAALLSGPPGVGKTTAVTLVCKELGFDTVEFNASDTRSKSLIKEQIGELLTTTSLSGFAKGNTGKSAITKKHVLVMDEVDGMAGNEDRGGLQELISLIKTTGVPIICMCNDRNSEKMRTLVNYCYDLKFSKPRVDQIKSAMLSICFKEKVKIPPDALTQLIVACSQDVRQTLTSLSMYAANPGVTADDARVKKDIKLGPWEVIRKVFSAEDHKTMSINDKSDLFFYDYSIAPLFVQENYLSVAPHCPKNEILDRMSQAADSISLGDIVESRIRRSQAWNLLPMQAMFSSVTPGTVLSGHVAGQIQFPGWLGKNSRANKMQRLAQEIHAHTRLSTTGSKSSIFLDYARYLRDAIVTPLVKLKSDGVAGAIEVLKAYHLPREDLDSLAELATWPGQRDPMILVDSKVKAAMTRTYNKLAPALPYAAPSFTKGKRQKDDGGESGTEDELNSDAEGDSMIKVKKKKESTKASTKKEAEPSTSKSKKGKGKK